MMMMNTAKQMMMGLIMLLQYFKHVKKQENT